MGGCILCISFAHVQNCDNHVFGKLGISPDTGTGQSGQNHASMFITRNANDLFYPIIGLYQRLSGPKRLKGSKRPKD